MYVYMNGQPISEKSNRCNILRKTYLELPTSHFPFLIGLFFFYSHQCQDKKFISDKRRLRSKCVLKSEAFGCAALYKRKRGNVEGLMERER